MCYNRTGTYAHDTSATVNLFQTSGKYLGLLEGTITMRSPMRSTCLVILIVCSTVPLGLSLCSCQVVQGSFLYFVDAAVLLFQRAVRLYFQVILPRLLETERAASGKCTMRIYFVLYYEATLANFLEIVMFHGHVCEQAGDLLIELVDYCARKMTMLISGWVHRGKLEFSSAMQRGYLVGIC